MKFLRFAVVVAGAALAVAAASAPASAAPPAQGIVGGGAVGTAPSWAAAVGDSSGMWCSGTLVAPQWVLTAGHCSGATRIRIGSKNLNSGGTLATVSRSVKHPNYNGGAYDFRLYKLSSPVSQAPVSLGTVSPAVGSAITLYGFGQTCAPYGCGDMSSVLKSVGTTVTSDANCGGISGPVELCFDTSTSATDCYGDSGGPAIAAGKLVGVTSRGADGPGADTCGKTNSIYGDATAVNSWIRSTTGI
ncbi:serine protease [Longispora fulva]|uniref:Snapalysin n=1 Tax=Longispora fulva TaxID=619741 RepID=A0A8J7GZU7_9ACTN|nr:trypsin-like serine protease [Longispora fulva]MBG6141496.1 snapalysin [Longispora fulva]GIG59354.1 serine protease [Longispora fulva]